MFQEYSRNTVLEEIMVQNWVLSKTVAMHGYLN